MPSCSEPVTAITISITGSSLLVGTEGGLVHSYDIVSHQLLRTISSHKGGTITFLRSILKPVDLVGHVSLNLHVSGVTDAKDVIPVRPVLPFQRIKDVKLRDTHEVTIMLAAVRNVSEARSSVSISSHSLCSRTTSNTRSRNFSKIMRSSSAAGTRNQKVLRLQQMPGWKS